MRKNLSPSHGTGPIAVPATTPLRRPYAPLLSLTERKAYQCVYRILRTYHIVPLNRGEVGEGREGKALAGPGARRSQLIDQLARVIVEEMGK